jgi:hypothetical protein
VGTAKVFWFSFDGGGWWVAVAIIFSVCAFLVGN